MIRLIENELHKVFKHKSVWVIFLLISLFCFANNFLFKVDYDDDGRYKFDDVDINKEIDNLEKELSKYDANNDNDKNIYVVTKTKLDVYKNMVNYDSNSWQFLKYNDYLYNSLYDINYYTYILKDKKLYDDSVSLYNERIKYFEDNNWKYFIYEEKKQLEKELSDIDYRLNNVDDTFIKDDLQKKYLNLENSLKVVNYRIINDIDYSNTYLNRSLIEYNNSMKNMGNYRDKKLNFSDRKKYFDSVSNYNINKYIVDNKVNLFKQNNLNYQLKNIATDYELFVVIIILLTTSILISEEFNKGTIKLLLIKPFSRSKILISKFIVSLLVVGITLVYLIINEFIFGSIMFGVSSLNNPVVIYDFNLNVLKEFNIYVYMFINISFKLSLYIMLIIISFFINLVIINGVGSFAVTMLFYTFSNVINNIIIGYKIKILRYFITLNWSFNDYLFGNLGSFEFLTLKKSFLIYSFYGIILLCLMFIIFNKKNIKNI